MYEDRNGDGIPEEYPIEHLPGEDEPPGGRVSTQHATASHTENQIIREYYSKNPEALERWGWMPPIMFKKMPQITYAEYLARKAVYVNG